MSIKLMTDVWELSGLNASQKLVLLCLADHANDRGLCWPSLQRIAERSDMSVRNCQRVLGQLAELGLIVKQAGLGRGNTTLYQVRPQAGKDDNLSSIDRKGDTVSYFPEKGDIQGRKGDILSEKVTSRDGKGDTGVTQTIIEPPIEPSEPDGSLAIQTLKAADKRLDYVRMAVTADGAVAVYDKDPEVAERMWRKWMERTLASAGLGEVRVEFVERTNNSKAVEGV